jgi:hypothetical protein
MGAGFFGRRSFFQLCSAAAAFLAGPQARRARAVPQNARTPVKHRKNFVAIQVKPYAWVDEGIDQLLDTIQQKGAVNTVWAYTYDYAEARMTKDGTIPLPDHGKSGSPEFAGGAFYDYDPKYFRDTSLTEFRSPDYGKFNVIAEVAPKAKARGMDFFAWDYNNAVPMMNRNIPNFAKVTEIDVYNRARAVRASTTPSIGRTSRAKSRASWPGTHRRWTASPGDASEWAHCRTRSAARGAPSASPAFASTAGQRRGRTGSPPFAHRRDIATSMSCSAPRRRISAPSTATS